MKWINGLMVCLLHVHVADPILNPFQLPDVTFCSAHRASSRPGSLAWPLASVFLTVFKHRNKQNTCCLYLLYVTSLSVRYRRHTSARQARQHGQEKRPRHPASLDEAHRASALSRGVSTCTTAIAPRSALDRASRMGTSCAHIHQRWSAAQRRAAAAASRPQVARAPRGCHGGARWPLGRHAPRAGASASPHAVDGRSERALKRRSGSSWLPG